MRIYPDVVIPPTECFNRGDQWTFVWIPLRKAQCGEPSRAADKVVDDRLLKVTYKREGSDIVVVTVIVKER